MHEYAVSLSLAESHYLRSLLAELWVPVFYTAAITGYSLISVGLKTVGKKYHLIVLFHY